jgi:hypothetical protein
MGTPDAYELSLVRMDGRYTTPRHRHNYDQIRFPLSGVGLNYGPGREVPLGAIGYFPEGTYYGPQDVPPGGVSMALQFGGASGQGMLSYDDLGRASKELSDAGAFEAGVYKRVLPDGRTVNKDGFEAVWEHVTGKPLTYPKARFEEPVVMHPEAFAWRMASEGCRIRNLGSFGERGVMLQIVGMTSGTFTLDARARTLGFVCSGATGSLNGRALALHDGFELEAGESGTLAGDDIQILLIHLPSAAAPAMAAA